ncbi:hypothetical protein Q8F55_001166 [Vanrija albida]|uniref:Extracellular membrane protein CFEM domain-containing protein n=1 Tax=Vanrija albida TaxID=181172 RepID=A0ABR3QFA6_9TREE
MSLSLGVLPTTTGSAWVSGLATGAQRVEVGEASAAGITDDSAVAAGTDTAADDDGEEPDATDTATDNAPSPTDDAPPQNTTAVSNATTHNTTYNATRGRNGTRTNTTRLPPWNNTNATGNNQLAPLVWASILLPHEVLCGASLFNVSDACCNASAGAVGLQPIPRVFLDGSESAGVQHLCLIAAASANDSATAKAAAKFTNCARWASNDAAVLCSVSTTPRSSGARRAAVAAAAWVLAAAVVAL